MDGKDELKTTLMSHFILYRNKAVLDQMKGGLRTLGVGEAMMKYPDILAPLFIAGDRTPLTAGKRIYYYGIVCGIGIIHNDRWSERNVQDCIFLMSEHRILSRKKQPTCISWICCTHGKVRIAVVLFSHLSIVL